MRLKTIEITALAILAAAALLFGCGKSMNEKSLYWHGELWDGMNRMAFTLQDLGFELRTVDTDKGVIVAESPAAGGEEREGETGKPYRIVVQFPGDPALPIKVGASQPEDQEPTPKKLREMVSKIKERFVWYAGTHVEVTE